MLSEVVFSIEGALLLCLLLTGEEVVRFEVFWRRIDLVAEDAVSASCGRDGDSETVFRTASPSLESQVQ